MTTGEPGLRILGRAWRLGDDISTDVLSPGAYAVVPLAERAAHTLEAVNPRFATEVRSGDVVVAGRNFGCGSSRETAPEGLKALGVGCVVAASFARLFLRNAVAIGLPVLPCTGAADAVADGDAIEVDLEAGIVRNPATGATLQGQPLAAPMLEVLRAGGIGPLLRRRARAAGSRG